MEYLHTFESFKQHLTESAELIEESLKTSFINEGYHSYKGTMKKDITLGGQMGSKYSIPKKSDMPKITFKKGEKVILDIQPNSYHLYSLDGKKHGYMDKQLAPQLRFNSIGDYVLRESLNEAVNEGYVVTTKNNRKIFISNENYKRLNKGKDVTGLEYNDEGHDSVWVLSSDVKSIKPSNDPLAKQADIDSKYESAINENRSLIKNSVQKAIKAAGYDLKQSEFKVGIKKDGLGGHKVSLNGEFLGYDGNMYDMIDTFTKYIIEDPEKYGLT